MRSYCLTLEEEGFVLHELRTQQVRDKKMKVSYYRLTSYVRSEPPLPLSFLSKEEMRANGAYEPHMYVSEARHKKMSVNHLSQINNVRRLYEPYTID